MKDGLVQFPSLSVLFMNWHISASHVMDTVLSPKGLPEDKALARATLSEAPHVLHVGPEISLAPAAASYTHAVYAAIQTG